MNKKMILLLSAACSFGLIAGNAFADDDSPATCGYDVSRAAALRKKGQNRLKKAEEILDKMESQAEKSAADLKSLNQKNAEAVVAGQSVHKFDSDVETVKDDDKLLPEALQQWGDCVVVIPNEVSVDLFIAMGENYGRGVEFCKGEDGTFDRKHPTFVQLEGLNLHFGIGVEATNLVLAVSKDSATNRNALISGDASASFGPWGRDADLGASIKINGKNASGSAVAASYSSSEGLFAGISLNGANLNDDETMNAAWNHKKLPKENFLMRLLHSSEEKKEDAACSNGGQPVADTRAAAVNSESAAGSLLPTATNEPAPSSAVSNLSMDNSVRPADASTASTATSLSASVGAAPAN